MVRRSQTSEVLVMMVKVNFYDGAAAKLACRLANYVEAELCHGVVQGWPEYWHDRYAGIITFKSGYGDKIVAYVNNIGMTVKATTVYGNEFAVYCGESTTAVAFNGRRHALAHVNNNAGHLYHALFGKVVESHDGVAIYNDEQLLNRGEVTLYETRRPDVPWWVCGLTA